MPKRATWAAVLGIALLGSAFAVWPDRNSADGPDETPSLPVSADERFPERLTEQTSYASLIVHGKVTDVQAGEVDDDDWTFRPRIVTLEVIEVLKGDQPMKTVTLAHSGWNDDGEGVIVNGAPWLYAGDEAVVFLEPVPASAAKYTFVNSQGQVLLKRGGQHPDAESDARHAESHTADLRPIETDLEGKDSSEALQSIRDAIQQAQGRDFAQEAADAEEQSARERWTGEPRDVLTLRGHDGNEWRLRAAPIDDGACFVMSSNAAAVPSTCATRAQLHELLSARESGVFWGFESEPGIVFGISEHEEVVIRTEDGSESVVETGQVDVLGSDFRLFASTIEFTDAGAVVSVEGVG